MAAPALALLLAGPAGPVLGLMGPERAQLTTKPIWAISGLETVKIPYELYKAELMQSQQFSPNFASKYKILPFKGG